MFILNLKCTFHTILCFIWAHPYYFPGPLPFEVFHNYPHFLWLFSISGCMFRREKFGNVSANMIPVMTCAFLIPVCPITNALVKYMKKHFVMGTKFQRGSGMILKEGKNPNHTFQWLKLLVLELYGTPARLEFSAASVATGWLFNVKFPRVPPFFELPWWEGWMVPSTGRLKGLMPWWCELSDPG